MDSLDEKNQRIYLILVRICPVCNKRVNTCLVEGKELVRAHYTSPGQKCPGTGQGPLEQPVDRCSNTILEEFL